MGHLKILVADERGVAAVEFAVVASMLCFALLNVVEFGSYIYRRMEVEDAAQIAVQSAWKACDLTHLPATTNCGALNSAVSAAIQSTSLGADVAMQGSPAEAYYCIDASGVLEYMADVAHKPTDCSAAGAPNVPPADYIEIAVTYDYTPIFPGITVGTLFPTPIVRSGLMRLK